MAIQGGAGTPRHYAVSELKNRVLNIAQTSVYHVKLQPPSEVISFLQSEGRGFNYYGLDGANVELLCAETALPGSTLATHDVTNDYHGVSEKMAYRRMYDDTIDLTFYVDRDYKVIEFFEGWMNFVTGEGTTLGRSDYKRDTAFYRMNYPKSYKSDIYLVKYEKEEPVQRNSLYYTFISAFPISITSMPVSYEQSNLLKCNVSFSYIRYVRERRFTTLPAGISDPRSPQAVKYNTSNTFFRPDLYGYQSPSGPNDFLNIGIPALDQFGVRDQLGRPPAGAPGPTVVA